MRNNESDKIKFVYIGIVFIAILSLSILFTACATVTFENASFKALNMAATTYEGTMETIGDAYKKGLISEESKEKIIIKANIYWKAYHKSVIAYEIYLRQTTSENKDELSDSLLGMNSALVEFLEFSQQEMN